MQSPESDCLVHRRKGRGRGGHGVDGGGEEEKAQSQGAGGRLAPGLRGIAAAGSERVAVPAGRLPHRSCACACVCVRVCACVCARVIVFNKKRRHACTHSFPASFEKVARCVERLTRGVTAGHHCPPGEPLSSGAHRRSWGQRGPGVLPRPWGGARGKSGRGRLGVRQTGVRGHGSCCRRRRPRRQSSGA